MQETFYRFANHILFIANLLAMIFFMQTYRKEISFFNLQELFTLTAIIAMYCFCSKTMSPVFVSIVLTTLLIRLAFIAIHPPSNYLYSDMKGYWDRGLAFYHSAPSHPYHSFYPPATHWHYGMFLKLFSLQNGHLLAIVGAMLSTAITYLIINISFLILGKKYAIVSGVISMAHYPFISFCGFFLAEIPYIFFTLLAINYFLKFYLKQKLHYFFIFLSFISVAIYFRSIALLLLLQGLLFFWALNKKKSLKVISSVMCLLLLTPSIVRNKNLTGDYHLISSNSGINFLQGNTFFNKYYFHSKYGKWVFQSPIHHIKRKNLPHFHTHLAPWNSAQLVELTIKELRQQKASAIFKNCISKSLDIFSIHPPWPESHSDFSKINFIYHIMFLTAIFPLVFLGICYLHCKKKFFTLVFLTTPILNTLAIAFVFYGTSRYRVPIDPFLIILSAVGLKATLETSRLVKKCITKKMFPIF